jgi:hypothetical protein
MPSADDEHVLGSTAMLSLVRAARGAEQCSEIG